MLNFRWYVCVFSSHAFCDLFIDLLDVARVEIFAYKIHFSKIHQDSYSFSIVYFNCSVRENQATKNANWYGAVHSISTVSVNQHCKALSTSYTLLFVRWKRISHMPFQKPNQFQIQLLNFAETHFDFVIIGDWIGILGWSISSIILW